MDAALEVRRPHGARWPILLAALLVGATLFGCGDALAPGIASPPEIGDLQLFPGHAVHVDTVHPMKSVQGVLTFRDWNGDLESLDLTILDEQGTVVSSNRVALAGLAGQVWGEIRGSAQIDASTAALYSIEVYVVDSQGLHSNTLTTRFEIVALPWRQIASPPRPLWDHAVAGLDGLIYVIGGYAHALPDRTYDPLTDVDVYDPATDSWSVGPPMSTPRRGAVAVTVDGRLYAIGGRGQHVRPPFGSVEVYDPDADAWSPAADMPTARYAAAAAVLDGLVYVAGGLGDQALSLDAFEAYDPALDQWTALPAPPIPRDDATLEAANAALFAIGGESRVFGSGSRYVEEVDVFDPTSGTWGAASPMPWPWPTRRAGSSVLDGRIHLMGGFNSASADEHRTYDPASDEWGWRMDLPEPMGEARAVEVGGKLYVFAGLSAWEYSPERELP